MNVVDAKPRDENRIVRLPFPMLRLFLCETGLEQFIDLPAEAHAEQVWLHDFLIHCTAADGEVVSIVLGVVVDLCEKVAGREVVSFWTIY